MMLNIKIGLIGLLAIIFNFVHAQDDSVYNLPVDDIGILKLKEKSGFVKLHTQGFGGGYRTGKHLTGFKKRILEAEFVTMKHPKEIRVMHQYPNANSFIYGKLNSFFVMRGHIGRQKIVYSKPNWGGVEVRFIYLGGVSLGMLKPVYLIISEDFFGEDKSIERYDPEIHDQYSIYGRASFFKGIDEIMFRPGLSAKAGFSFEFGVESEIVNALEVGSGIDVFYPDVPIMANNDPQYTFLTLFVSYHFGKRFNP